MRRAKVNNTHLLDHLSILRLFPFPYVRFSCDIHRTQGAPGMNTAWLLLIGRTTVLFPIFNLLMLCILLAFLAMVICLVSIF